MPFLRSGLDIVCRVLSYTFGLLGGWLSDVDSVLDFPLAGLDRFVAPSLPLGMVVEDTVPL